LASVVQQYERQFGPINVPPGIGVVPPQPPAKQEGV
jgi:hypothetical protein